MGLISKAVSKVVSNAKAAKANSSSSGSSSGSSSSSSSSGSSNNPLSYKSGGNYGDRVTRFTWDTPTGTKTTSSNATNYQDAAKEAGIDLTTSKLSSASSYFDNMGKAVPKSNGYHGASGGSGIWSKDGETAGYASSLAAEKALADQYNMIVAGVNAPIGTVTNAGASTHVAPLPSIAENLANQSSEQYGLRDSANNIANYNDVLSGQYPVVDTQPYTMPEYDGISANDIQDQYDDIYDTQEQAARAQIAALKQQYDYNADQLNQTYDKNATQNYTDYMMSTKNLPQQLRALGLSGGASETSLMGAEANYQNALNENELSRANALNQNNLAYASNEAEYGTNMAQIYSTLQQSAMSAVMQAQQYESEYNQWVQEYQAARTDADRSYAMQKAQLAQDNANTLYNQAQQQTQYSDTLKQQALENAYAAADMGDFSKLKALGVNTTAAEADYALAQKTATAQYNKQYGTGTSGSSARTISAGNSGSGGKMAVAKETPVKAPAPAVTAEPSYFATLDSMSNNASSNATLERALAQAVNVGTVTQAQINAWLNKRAQ